MLLIRLGRSPNERIHVSPKDDSRVLRRIDLALLPLMLSVYFLQALDKATLSYASIFGLIEDTKLVGNQFSWLGSIVFLAQLVMQLPLALALVKLPIGKFTGAMVLGWGLTLTAMTWASTFSQLMAARFFLGAFEASVGPSFVAITQMWWRRREQTMRIGSWYCMNGLTWVFGSLATYGLASITSSLRPYQIIFLTFGIVTVVVAGAMFIWMPDSPTEAKFLTDDDKLIAIERLRGNQMGVMSREWRQAHFYEALQDVKTWLWVAMILCISVPSNGISTFGPLIIHSFVSDPFDTILFNVPVGISHVIAVSVSAYVSMKWKVKGLVIILLCIPPIIGFSILLSFPHDDAHRAILLADYFCLSTFTGISMLSLFYFDFFWCILFPLLTRLSAVGLFVVCAKYRGRHKAKVDFCAGIHRVFCRQHYWPATVYTRRGAIVQSRSEDEHCSLQRSYFARSAYFGPFKVVEQETCGTPCCLG